MTPNPNNTQVRDKLLSPVGKTYDVLYLDGRGVLLQFNEYRGYHSWEDLRGWTILNPRLSDVDLWLQVYAVDPVGQMTATTKAQLKVIIDELIERLDA